MICSKCGFECGDSKYCPKCGTKLVKECKKCGAVLTEGNFCPNCGKDNSKPEKDGSWETAGLVAFITTITLSALKIIDLFTVRGSIHIMVNQYFFNAPYFTYVAGYAVIAALIIVFSCLLRKTKMKGFGIVAIILAALLKVMCAFSPAFIIILAGTIVHHIAIRNSKEKFSS